MIAFDVRDMYSSRSAGAIIKSVKAVDGSAMVRVNMAMHCVEIESDRAQAGELSEAIGRAGFTAVPLSSPGARIAAPKIQFDGTVDVLLPGE